MPPDLGRKALDAPGDADRRAIVCTLRQGAQSPAADRQAAVPRLANLRGIKDAGSAGDLRRRQHVVLRQAGRTGRTFGDESQFRQVTLNRSGEVASEIRNNPNPADQS
jgi:hypothetical protein